MAISKTKVRAVRLFILLAGEALIIILIFRFILFAGYVTSASMEPTLGRGVIVIGARYSVAGTLERGDIVLFVEEGKRPMAKRIIGLPGEEVQIKEDGTIWIDGSLHPEPYVDHQRIGYTGHFEVPPGCYLLLGDNRANSNDSRFWEQPYVEKEAIIAKIFQ